MCLERCTVETLDLLNTHLKNILSLKEIIVNFQVPPKGTSAMKKMNEYGWAVEVTKLPKKVWISYDDRAEFDNEEDYNA